MLNSFFKSSSPETRQNRNSSDLANLFLNASVSKKDDASQLIFLSVISFVV